jgi:hypothetical protein
MVVFMTQSKSRLHDGMPHDGNNSDSLLRGSVEAFSTSFHKVFVLWILNVDVTAMTRFAVRSL